MEPPLWQCAIAVQTDPNIFFHCRPVDGATVMATKLVVEIGDAASRAGLSRVGYVIPLNAARWTGIRLVFTVDSHPRFFSKPISVTCDSIHRHHFPAAMYVVLHIGYSLCYLLCRIASLSWWPFTSTSGLPQAIDIDMWNNWKTVLPRCTSSMADGWCG